MVGNKRQIVHCKLTWTWGLISARWNSHILALTHFPHGHRFFAGLSITHPQIWAPCARASWSTQCGTYITSIVSQQHLDWRWFCFKFQTTAQNFANNIQCKLRRNFFVHNTVSQNWKWQRHLLKEYFLQTIPIYFLAADSKYWIWQILEAAFQ